MKKYLGRMRGSGKCPPRKPLSKIAWSWLGAFIGIYAISVCGQFFKLSLIESSLLIASFGASAVLVYGAPLAEFSQPRNLIGGHVLSAIVGVTAFRLLSHDYIMAGALSVSVAIVVMHLTRTMHPPGGATALTAIIGGEKIHSLGYVYVFFPVLTGALILLLVALLINNMSKNPKRHYPVYWF